MKGKSTNVKSEEESCLETESVATPELFSGEVGQPSPDERARAVDENTKKKAATLEIVKEEVGYPSPDTRAQTLHGGNSSKEGYSKECNSKECNSKKGGHENRTAEAAESVGITIVPERNSSTPRGVFSITPDITHIDAANDPLFDSVVDGTGTEAPVAVATAVLSYEGNLHSDDDGGANMYVAEVVDTSCTVNLRDRKAILGIGALVVIGLTLGLTLGRRRGDSDGSSGSQDGAPSITDPLGPGVSSSPPTPEPVDSVFAPTAALLVSNVPTSQRTLEPVESVVPVTQLPTESPSCVPVKQSYEFVTSGSCEAHDYFTIVDKAECYEATESIGFGDVTRYSVGTDVVNGCSLSTGDSVYSHLGIFFVEPDVCLSNCECNDRVRCLCSVQPIYLPTPWDENVPSSPSALRTPQPSQPPPALPPTCAPTPSDPLYKIVTSGTCESHGYHTISDFGWCFEAMDRIGFGDVPKFSVGPNVVDGCTLSTASVELGIFHNNPGACTSGTCQCSEETRCVCSESKTNPEVAVTTTTLPTIGALCTDKNTQCSSWAGVGECSNNSAYMLTQCQQSCGVCGERFFELRSEVDDTYCLDVQGGEITNFTPLWLYKCKGTPAQLFRIDGDGRLRSQLSPNTCIEMDPEHAVFVHSACHDTWTILRASDEASGIVSLRNDGDDMCVAADLSDYQFEITNGTLVTRGECVGSLNSEFKLMPVEY